MEKLWFHNPTTSRNVVIIKFFKERKGVGENCESTYLSVGKSVADETELEVVLRLLEPGVDRPFDPDRFDSDSLGTLRIS